MRSVLAGSDLPSCLDAMVLERRDVVCRGWPKIQDRNSAKRSVRWEPYTSACAIYRSSSGSKRFHWLQSMGR